MLGWLGVIIFIVACFAFPPLGWCVLALIGLAFIGSGK